MKLSISNIGWNAEHDETVYLMMKKYGFFGLEIAPTRIFPEAPYDKLEKARIWADNLKKLYGFSISSMQSIWYGRQENIFGTEKEFQALVAYTKKAIDFAAVIGCGNLVFGCPRNRNFPEGADPKTGIRFFREIGDYAAVKGTVIGMEANPPIYNTNYVNNTSAAFALIDEVSSEGFKLNLDVGTMIQNEEEVDELTGRIHLINHVHISEPRLKPIEQRELHSALRDVLADEGYEGYVSIEMGRTDEEKLIEEKISYMRRIFNE